MNAHKKHPTFIINLRERTDRKEHCIEAFKNHPEFNLTFVEAIKNQSGAQGLFASYQNIIREASNKNHDYVIICEDDHAFTSAYTPLFLNMMINEAYDKKCDVLLGGPSNIHDALFFSNNLYWIGGFTGLQFAVVFKSFYHYLLDFSLPEGKNIDLILGKISDKVFGCYPPISYQKSFGYSDVTVKNNNIRIEEYFESCQLKLERLYKISKYFGII